MSLAFQKVPKNVKFARGLNFLLQSLILYTQELVFMLANVFNFIPNETGNFLHRVTDTHKPFQVSRQPLVFSEKI